MRFPKIYDILYEKTFKEGIRVMKTVFDLPYVKYEGAKSRNPLSFKYYNKDEVIGGKTMGEHLRFSMVYWHTLCAEVPVGARRLLFLPYLMGERTPVLDADARGAFVGLSALHGVPEMTRALQRSLPSAEAYL